MSIGKPNTLPTGAEVLFFYLFTGQIRIYTANRLKILSYKVYLFFSTINHGQLISNHDFFGGWNWGEWGRGVTKIVFYSSLKHETEICQRNVDVLAKSFWLWLLVFETTYFCVKFSDHEIFVEHINHAFLDHERILKK